ncbi:MAG: hypothetical protein KGO92_03675 [Bacteroidota bacterium]|nr:hypothetical protein [Bacteroidota bacterium]
MKKFKEEDLILYLYNECPPKISAAINAALAEEDLELKDRLQVLRRTIKQLDKLKLSSPSKSSIQAILKHASAQTGRK